MNNIQSLEEYRKKREQQKLDDMISDFENEEEYVYEICTMLGREVCDALVDLGYNVEDNPETFRDVFTLLECLKGIVERVRGNEHPFHVMSNTITNTMETEHLAEYLKVFLYGSDEDEE